MSYVGNQGTISLLLYRRIQAIKRFACSLSSQLRWPGQSGLRPFGEDALITSSGGQQYQGTELAWARITERTPLKERLRIPTTNALETNLRYVGKNRIFGWDTLQQVDRSSSNLANSLIR